jgi:riboflavin transporter FmnP
MDDKETEALMGTVAIGSMVSIVSVLFLVTSAVVLGKWRKSYWRVVLGLALSDLTVSCSFVPPPPPTPQEDIYLY